MKAIIILCFTLLAVVAIGQDIPSDIKQLIASSKKDTALVNKLNERLNVLIYNNPEQGVVLAEYIDSLAKQLNYRKGEARALDLMGDVQLRMFNYPRSLEVQIQSIKINEEIGEAGAVAGCMISMSQLFAAQGDRNSQIAYLKSADSIARLVKDTIRILYCIENISSMYLDEKKIDSALALLNEGYAIYLKTGNSSDGNIQELLSYTHFMLGDMDLAFSYSKMAEKEALKGNNTVLINVYMDRVNYFNHLQKKDSALYYSHKGFDLSTHNNILYGVVTFSHYLDQLYQEVDEKKSIYYHKIADSIYFNNVETDKNRMLASMLENEKDRQAKLRAQQLASKEERKASLQLSVIFISIITVFVLFMLLSHSTIGNQKLIRFLGALVLLVLFEFINLILHPYLGEWTHHTPTLMLLVMVCIAALLIPLHHKLEHWITDKLVEKNNRIRLAAAKKTIAKLEGQ